MATVISALALSVVFLICNLTPTPAFADLVYEDGYSVTTVFDGNKLNIHPHSVLPQPGSSDLFLLDSTDNTV
nr:putative transcription factor WD40-like family [Ipomoea batatas]GMD26293.1 putative transcription factor WD40-like family [Ipomoea batatas]